ncbi:hypothetical protein C0Q70_17600 [Pomacea canaliculata]|uniref:Ig-like domain-containing protein n=1 Tax=Pomacea canaliculata TaxID=400727 RepID=A0A2T7NKV9_POMCA|nr:hypothetical protein C0Q70_17600 [Pomacea canaliculata]
MVVQMLYWTVGWASNRLKCVRSPGIEYEVVNSDLKLTFRHVTLNHNGTYSCHLDGYGSTHIETCDFQIQDVTLVEKVDQTNNTLAIVLGLLASNFLLVVGIVSLRGPVIPDIKNAQEMSVVRHDKAMQHVLHCLHHMADQEKDKMFVLTQFNYDDYLNNTGIDYQHHGLPVPSGVIDDDDDVACVDFVIVHREHGVLVGVVKAVSDKVEDSDDGQQDEGGCIVTAVTEAVQQLQKAKRVIQHVMSDQIEFPTVRQTLILPNLTHASLRRAVARQNALVERLRKCLDVTAIEDPTNQCLCVEDLSDPSSPWVVGPHVVNTLRNRWMWTWARVHDVVMTDDLYLTVIARSNMKDPALNDLYLKCAGLSVAIVVIINKLVLMTLHLVLFIERDLYERCTLPPDMVDMLNEQRLFLVGPPSDDKMRMLALAGKLWLSQGHQVYILCSSSEARDNVMSTLYNMLQAGDDTEEASVSSRGRLMVLQCDLKDKNEVEKILTKLNIRKGGSLYVIAEDDVVSGIDFRSFCETLIIRCPDLYFWATSSTDNNVPDGWTVKTFTQILTCPPAVVREVLNVEASPVIPGGVPTNDISATTSTGTSHGQLISTAVKRASTLHNKDILILFENDIEKMKQFLIGLNECGITVSIFQGVNGKYGFPGNNNSVCAMDISQLDLYKPRKKVVLYVEKHLKSPGYVSKKRLAQDICTSQLIILQRNP